MYDGRFSIRLILTLVTDKAYTRLRRREALASPPPCQVEKFSGWLPSTRRVGKLDATQSAIGALGAVAAQLGAVRAAEVELCDATRHRPAKRVRRRRRAQSATRGSHHKSAR